MTRARVRRWPRVVALLVAVGLAFGGGWWAAGSVTSTAEDAPEVAEPVLAEVIEASVGRTVTYTATVRQPFATIAINALTGVVTSVSDASEALSNGATLYVVGATPVRVIEGEEPFWRTLQRDAKGEDVAQLQRALIALDYLPDGSDDGTFGAATAAAVREWQDDLGQERTGSIGLGELIAVPSLPQALSLNKDEIFPGAQLVAGTGAIGARTGEIVVELILGPDQARLIPGDAAISLTYEDSVWDAVIAQQGEDEAGQVVLTLTAPDGGAVCGQECDALPAAAELTVPAAVELSPAITGPAVPVTAVLTTADGTNVLLEDGSRVVVTVLGSSGGLAVVDGLDVGQLVRVGEQPASDPPNGDGDATDG